MIRKIRRIIAVIIASCAIMITLGRYDANATGLSMFSDDSHSNDKEITCNIEEPKI